MAVWHDGQYVQAGKMREVSSDVYFVSGSGDKCRESWRGFLIVAAVASEVGVEVISVLNQAWRRKHRQSSTLALSVRIRV
jgi:hypothetical protein